MLQNRPLNKEEQGDKDIESQNQQNFSSTQENLRKIMGSTLILTGLRAAATGFITSSANEECNNPNKTLALSIDFATYAILFGLNLLALYVNECRVENNIKSQDVNKYPNKDMSHPPIPPIPPTSPGPPSVFPIPSPFSPYSPAPSTGVAPRNTIQVSAALQNKAVLSTLPRSASPMSGSGVPSHSPQSPNPVTQSTRIVQVMGFGGPAAQKRQ